MDKEEIKDYLKRVDELKQENKQLKIQISAREEEYRELEDKYKELDKMCELYSKSLYNAELNQYKNNWNKLKEYCKDNVLCYEVGDDENTKLIGSRIHGLNVLDKMQELEESDE